jgi:hypothetical protein
MCGSYLISTKTKFVSVAFSSYFLGENGYPIKNLRKDVLNIRVSDCYRLPQSSCAASATGRTVK